MFFIYRQTLSWLNKGCMNNSEQTVNANYNVYKYLQMDSYIKTVGYIKYMWERFIDTSAREKSRSCL